MQLFGRRYDTGQPVHARHNLQGHPAQAYSRFFVLDDKDVVMIDQLGQFAVFPGWDVAEQLFPAQGCDGLVPLGRRLGPPVNELVHPLFGERSQAHALVGLGRDVVFSQVVPL